MIPILANRGLIKRFHLIFNNSLLKTNIIMAECTKSESSQITLLPTEILYMILKHNNCREILNFGATCRRFNELVNNGQYLWKAMLKNS